MAHTGMAGPGARQRRVWRWIWRGDDTKTGGGQPWPGKRAFHAALTGAALPGYATAPGTAYARGLEKLTYAPGCDMMTVHNKQGRTKCRNNLQPLWAFGQRILAHSARAIIGSRPIYSCARKGAAAGYCLCAAARRLPRFFGRNRNKTLFYCLGAGAKRFNAEQELFVLCQKHRLNIMCAKMES